MKHDILTRAMGGEILQGVEIIDAHCHLGSYFNYYFPTAGADEMVEDATRMGVSRLIISPHAAISADFRYGNAMALAAIKRYPDIIQGFLTLNTNFPEEYDEQFDLYYTREDFVGIKLHPSGHQARLDSTAAFQVFELVAHWGGFVLCHTWHNDPYCNPQICEILLKTFPQVPFVFAHAAGIYESVYEVIRMVNQYENAYMDTSGFEFSNVSLEEIANRTDTNKIIFGSDIPFHDIRPCFSRVAFSYLCDAVKERIFSLNYKNMLRMNPKKK